MSKANFKNLLSAIIVIGILIVFPTHFANASGSILGMLTDVSLGFILQILSYVIYFVLSIASFALTISAAILNVSIYFTTNLQEFINNTPAIFQVWQVLRDLASLVFIFLLLYAAIKTVLSLQDAKYGELLKNIIIVGILINFSFFITTVLIDASNIVSLQLYNAIAPEQTSSGCDNGAGGTGGVNGYFSCKVSAIIGNSHGGLATVIVNSLDVTQWWSNDSAFKAMESNSKSSPSQISIGTRMILVNAGALAVTVLAAVSFLGAAAAAIWRIAVLIILLAFSPLWIVGYALPQIKEEVSKKWVNHLKANLIFLPVYLLLMYVVIYIITTLNLGALGSTVDPSSLIANTANANWYQPFLQLFAGFAIILFLINMPLVTALSFSGAANSITGKIASSVRNWTLDKTKWTGGWATRKTIGAGALAADKALSKTRVFGGTVLGRDIRTATMGALSKNKFGTGRSADELSKEIKAARQARVQIDRRHQLLDVLAGKPLLDDQGKEVKDKNGNSLTKQAAAASVIGKMNEKEKLALGSKTLMQEEVISNLKKDDLDAIRKSEDFTPEESAQIAKKRKDTFEGAIKNASGDTKQAEILKTMVKNSDAGAIAGLDEEMLKNPSLIAHMTPEHLKKIRDSEVSEETKKKVAEAIRDWHTTHATISGGKRHRAFNYINKNKEEWGV
ncbi:MAG: hypothetical protein KGI66_01105 [Patescibacteria group bacterium]|nr:hypothetical protein [Patescibacteria group bacterium]